MSDASLFPAPKIVVVGRDRERALMTVDALRDEANHQVFVFGDDTGLAHRRAEIAPDVVLIDIEDPNREVLEAPAVASSPMKRTVAKFVDRSDDSSAIAAV